MYTMLAEGMEQIRKRKASERAAKGAQYVFYIVPFTCKWTKIQEKYNKIIGGVWYPLYLHS